LGSPSDFAESTLNVDSDVGVATGGTAEATKTHAGDGAGSGSPSEVGNKRRRCMLSEGNIIVLTGMTDAVNRCRDQG
jgi:hypothetical protein